MKRLQATTAAFVMGAAVVSAPVYAQVSADLGAEIDEGTTASIDQQANTSDAFSVITGSAGAIRSITSMDSFSGVTVTRITGADNAQINLVVSENRQSVYELQSAIASNPEVADSLAAQGVDLSSIVGAEVAGNGALVLYQL